LTEKKRKGVEVDHNSEGDCGGNRSHLPGDKCTGGPTKIPIKYGEVGPSVQLIETAMLGLRNGREGPPKRGRSPTFLPEIITKAAGKGRTDSSP